VSRDIRKKLEAVRAVTGDAFSARKGYDLRKPLSKRRIKTIEHYYEVLLDLTSRSHVVYTPKKGEKMEAFEFTGQTGMPRFTKAFVHKVDPDAQMAFVVDKTRPKHSRFVAFNRKNGQAHYNVPASAFIDEQDDDLEAQGIDPGEHYADILREYAPDAEMFMIAAGPHYMWGSAGQHEMVGQKVADLFRSYGAGQFDPGDKNSHYFGNWFNGVKAYTRAQDAFPYMRERVRADTIRREERHITTPEKYRVLRSGDIGVFLNGRLIRSVPSAKVEPYDPTRAKKKKR